MKHIIICLFTLLLCFGCSTDNKLSFEPISLAKNECPQCPLIEISFPSALGKNKIDTIINTALREEVISLLNFDDGTNVTNIESAITSFTVASNNLREKYADETAKWEAKINGTVSFENKSVLTIRLDSYLFTGGAHGYSTSRFLNFDKRKGIELENSELFKNLKKLQGLIEAKFRLQENIPNPNSINSTGFMFEMDTFYLPENIGYTPEGIQLFYEQYEIASFTDGPITLTLPYNEVQKFLVLPMKP